MNQRNTQELGVGIRDKSCAPGKNLLACTLLAAALLFLTACTQQTLTPSPIVVRVVITATPEAIPTRANTPPPTATPTPTSTPTPTLLPLPIFGEPREAQLHGPTPEVGAYCGLVDTLDFPLDPPEAATVRGGGDYGLYRSRYEKYHAGEDWGFSRGAGLGAPVYSIGHGTVTYADGLGWGPDKGVVVIRHHFPDGSVTLSFYGHLDPPSVTLTAGECVTRGQQIGEIGRPRTRPHLHLEIRTHMPYVAGPGYWETDPTFAGWLPPSDFIWDYRVETSPGVRWSLIDTGISRGLGPLDADTFVVWEGDLLVGLNPENGGLRWRHPLASAVVEAALSPEAGLLFTITRNGTLEALRLPQAGEAVEGDAFLVSVWQSDFDTLRFPELIPLPGGGVLVFSSAWLGAVSDEGELLWAQDFEAANLAGWITQGDQVIFSLEGSPAGVWVTEGLAPRLLSAEIAGKLAVDGDQVYVLGTEALHQLGLQGGEPQVLQRLPRALAPGELVVHADGSLTVLHADFYDTRLLALDAEGRLLWERSVTAAGGGRPQLFMIEDEALLLQTDTDRNASYLSLFVVDRDEPALLRVFLGGTRTPAFQHTWGALLGGGRLILKIGGGSLLLFELPAAR